MLTVEQKIEHLRKLGLDGDMTEIEKMYSEKNKLLDNLFPNHGPIFAGGDGLFAIIGMVDLDGFNYINARVHFNASSLVHLEEYVFVASNVEFGNNNITFRKKSLSSYGK